MITVEDAIEALGELPASPATDRLQDFFAALVAKVEPVEIPTDEEGFIIEGALQHGFDHIDDDATLLVVSAQALINYTKRQRGAP